MQSFNVVSYDVKGCKSDSRTRPDLYVASAKAANVTAAYSAPQLNEIRRTTGDQGTAQAPDKCLDAYKSIFDIWGFDRTRALMATHPRRSFWQMDVEISLIGLLG